MMRITDREFNAHTGTQTMQRAIRKSLPCGLPTQRGSRSTRIACGRPYWVKTQATTSSAVSAVASDCRSAASSTELPVSMTLQHSRLMPLFGMRIGGIGHRRADILARPVANSAWVRPVPVAPDAAWGGWQSGHWPSNSDRSCAKTGAAILHTKTAADRVAGSTKWLLILGDDAILRGDDPGSLAMRSTTKGSVCSGGCLRSW